MFSVDKIFLLNITYVFAIITCLGFLVLAPLEEEKLTHKRTVDILSSALAGH